MVIVFWYTSRKNILSFFFNFLKRWSSQKIALVFEKKMHWNLIFFVLSGRIIFLFPKNKILFFRRKVKDNISPENTWNYDIFCIFSNNDIWFSHKYGITLFSKKRMMTISQKIHLKMTFLVSLKNIIFILENMVFLMIK